MEEARWAAKVLGEIGSARAAIGASYLRLWRAGSGLPEPRLDPSQPAADEQAAPSHPPATPPQETE